MRALKSKAVALLGASILLLALGGSSVVTAGGVPARHGSTMSGGTSVDLAGALAADGTFSGSPAVAGPVDASRWSLASNLAAGEPPRFAPTTGAISASALAWSALGSNAAGNGALSTPVLAIAVAGTDVYVGGFFTNAAGIAAADYLARWNGTAWSAVGSNAAGNAALNGAVRALAVSGADLYVGGDFSNAAGIAEADEVAHWNGSAWSALGSNGAGDGAIHGVGPGQNVSSLAITGADIYVGGGYSDAAGIPEADYIAKWNGSAWSALGSDGAGGGAVGPGCVAGQCYQPNITALAVSGTNVYIGGFFSNVAGLAAADDVALWNGTAWSALGSNASGNGAIVLDDGNYVYSVNALAVIGTDLYVGGSFKNAAGILTADLIARWSGTAWSGLGSTNAPINGVTALAVSGTDLYVGGAVTGGTTQRAAVIRWNGGWSALGSFPAGAEAGFIMALATSSSGVYAGGRFANAGGVAAADNVAKWGQAASVVRKPDGRIRLGTASYVGNNVYNTTASGQSRTGSARRGHNVSFGISIQNDGNTTDRFTVKATGLARSAYIVKYFRGTTDITRAVVAGTYRTPLLVPAGTYLITARVTVRSTASVGSAVTRLVTISSVANTARKDAVKFTAKRA